MKIGVVADKTRFRKPLLPVVISVLSLISILISSGSAAELTVFAAAGARPAIDELGRIFEKKSGTKIKTDYGGGGEMLSKMLIAKSGDTYIAPEQRFMMTAKDKGVVEPETIRAVAYMVPVLDGNKFYKKIIGWADIVLATGTVFANGTIEKIARVRPIEEIIFYGVTVSAIAELLKLKRVCFYPK